MYSTSHRFENGVQNNAASGASTTSFCFGYISRKWSQKYLSNKFWSEKAVWGQLPNSLPTMHACTLLNGFVLVFPLSVQASLKLNLTTRKYKKLIRRWNSQTWLFAHFGLRPWDNRGKFYMDGKRIQWWSNAWQHISIYLQPFTSYSEILVGNCNFFLHPCI